MRVGHFVQRWPPALGGSEAYFARLSRWLAASGDEVTVFTTDAVDLDALWSPAGRRAPAGVSAEGGVTVRRYPLWRMHGRRWLLKPLSLLPHRGWQALTLPCNPISPRMWADAGRAADRFDVVHATAFPYVFPIACARRLARRLGVPFLLTPFVHTGDPDDPADRTRRAFTQPALLALARSADRVFVQTEGERRTLAECGVPEGRLVVQGMGVDRDACTGGDRGRARTAWGVGDKDVVVGHLANLSAEKGTVDLLRAAERVWADGGCFRVVLSGGAMPNFERFWPTYAAAGQVRRLGVLDEGAKRDFFAGIDLFALPSRADSFGLVLLEAWANGIPNVAYRAGGVAWTVRHEEDGLLVKCGDVAGLAAALRRLADDAGLRRRLGAAGRDRTRREFEWEDKLRVVREVCRGLTPAPRGCAAPPGPRFPPRPRRRP
jgi:glycosyltransferase involved in cell wall biosynthesis